MSQEFSDLHSELPWRSLIGLRNVLAQKYGDIDRGRLYETAVRELPALIAQLKALLPPI